MMENKARNKERYLKDCGGIPFCLTPSQETDMLYRTQSVILGHAIGDALGVPVEFMSRDELREHPVTDMQGYGTYPVPAGSWSDDTSMSIATLDSLSKGKIDYDDIMERFVRWCCHDEYTPCGEMFDIGKTCLGAINNYLKTEGKPAVECGLRDERSNGNGSLMRINPIVLYLFAKGYSLKEAIPIVEEASSVTHAHERSRIACGIYTCVLYELLKKPHRSSVRSGLNKARRYYFGKSEFELYDRLLFKRIGMIYRNFEEEALPVREDEIKSTGYVVDTLEAAIWCLLNTESYRDCVLKAVNLGDDTDTVAAVAGGLAGALYGLDSMPTEWLETLQRRDCILEMCGSFSQGLMHR